MKDSHLEAPASHQATSATSAAAAPAAPWRTRYLTLALILLGLAFASIWTASSYFDITPSAIISLHLEDGHCITGQQGLGAHCFSDFGIVREIFSAPDPWNAGQASTTYPPLAWAPALLLAGLNKFVLGNGAIGLWIYLALSAACLLVPSIWAARRRPLGEGVLFTLLLSVASAPALMLLDRGNTLSFAIPFILLAAVSFFRDNARMLSIAVVGAALVKPQLILLVGLLLAAKKYKQAAASIVATTVITAASFLLFWRNFPANLFGWLRALRGYNDYQKLDVAYPYNLGVGRSIVTILDVVTGGRADPGLRSALIDGLGVAQTAITLAVVILGLWLMWFAGLRVHRGYLLALCLLTILYTSSVVYSYYTAPLIVLAALLLRDPGPGGEGRGALDTGTSQNKVLSWATTIAVPVALAPIIWPTSAPIFTEGMHASLANWTVGLYQILVGPLLLAYFVVLVVGLIRQSLRLRAAARPHREPEPA